MVQFIFISELPKCQVQATTKCQENIFSVEAKWKFQNLSNNPIIIDLKSGFYIPMKARYEGISGIKLCPCIWTLNFEVVK